MPECERRWRDSSSDRENLGREEEREQVGERPQQLRVTPPPTHTHTNVSGERDAQQQSGPSLDSLQMVREEPINYPHGWKHVEAFWLRKGRLVL